MKMTKLIKNHKAVSITVNYLDKYKRDILIEGDKKSLSWLADFLHEAANRKVTEKDDCEMSISPHGIWRKLFTRNSDLGLHVHRIPCSDGRKPIKGFSDKKERIQFYAKTPPSFSNIYRRIMKLWPKQIKLFPLRRNNEGHAWFPSLSNAWSEADNLVDPVDIYGSLMVWTMYQVFTDAGRDALNKKKRIFYTRKVKKKLIEARFFKNLQVPGYSKERKRYIRK